jgi:hypothetical protein
MNTFLDILTGEKTMSASIIETEKGKELQFVFIDLGIRLTGTYILDCHIFNPEEFYSLR